MGAYVLVHVWVSTYVRMNILTLTHKNDLQSTKPICQIEKIY